MPIDAAYAQFKNDELTPWLLEVPSQILRNAGYRFMCGFMRWYKGLGGKPRVKKNTGRQSVMITKELFSFKDNLLILGTKSKQVGVIELSAPPPEGVNSINISLNAGKFYLAYNFDDASIYTPSEADVIEELKQYAEAELAQATLGLDRGIVLNVATSNQTAYAYSDNEKKSLEKAEKGKRRWQRRLARRVKGSNRSRKARGRVSKYADKQANIRENFAHQVSRKIVEEPEIKLFVFEKLNLANMTKSAKGTVEKPGKNVRQKAGLNRSLLNAGLGKIKQYTKYKALRKNKVVVEVNPKYSSQECSRCHYIHKQNRISQGLFCCTSCGFSANADYNAAEVVKYRGMQMILNDEWKAKEVRKVRVGCRAGTVQTGEQSPNAQGDSGSPRSLEVSVEEATVPDLRSNISPLGAR